MDSPEESERFRQELGAAFTFLSDENGELLDKINVRHRAGYKGEDIAFPTGILVDGHGIVRWVYEAEFGHMRMTPADLFEAMERLALEEQNRELRRVRGVGQVVRQVFLMKKPEDLASTIEVMQGELRRLGLEFSLCGIAIVTDDRRHVRAFTARENGELATTDISVDEQPEVRDLIRSWNPGEVRRLRLDESAHRSAPQRKLEGLRWLLAAPFSHGAVFLGGAGASEPAEDHEATVAEFADAISVAFQRFVDFGELEKQNKQLQEAQLQLVQSEKMASLGQLVAGVAHELNTPIGAIQSNTQTEATTLKRIQSLIDGGKELTEAELASLSRLVGVLEEMNVVSATACRRIHDIVSNLRKFARLDESAWQPADLRQGLDETLALVHYQTKDRIEIERLYEDIPLVRCYAGQINQVFMNLIMNGIQAIDGKGRLRIGTRLDGNEVHVIIEDSGSGIAEADLARVFDPGFTTKGVGVGMGLGLSICYRIAQNHGGRLSVESARGRGSIFTLVLPLQATPPRAPAEPRTIFSLSKTPEEISSPI